MAFCVVCRDKLSDHGEILRVGDDNDQAEETRTQ